MAKQLQLRGGTTSEHSTFTGAVREVTVDTDKDTLVVHDGGTAGGFPLATATNFASTGIDDNATSTAITINSFEQVGIGTTSPNHLLHLKQTSGDLVIQTEGALKKWSIRNHADGYFGLYNHTHGRWLTLSTPGAEYHLLHANGSERMRITPSGNVGIGTTAPSQLLHLKKTSGNLIIQTEGVSKTWSIRNQADGYFGLYNHTHGHWVSLSDPGNTIYRLYTNGLERLRITPSGNVGIGTTAPTEKLYVAGNIYATGNITAYSDERLKTNINELNNTLSAIQNIRGISYTRSDTKDNSIGVMAQDVETMFPELISEDYRGMKGVNYNGLVGVLFSAVKELSNEVTQLKKRVN